MISNKIRYAKNVKVKLLDENSFCQEDINQQWTVRLFIRQRISLKRYSLS